MTISSLCTFLRRTISLLTEGRAVAARDASWWQGRRQEAESQKRVANDVESRLRSASASVTEHAQQAKEAVQTRNDATDNLVERNDRTRDALAQLIRKYRGIHHHGG